MTRSSTGCRLSWCAALTVLVATAFALPACSGNECDVGEHRCDGDSALNCVAPEEEPRVLRSQQCGAGECKTDQSSAFCTVSTTLEPNCVAGVLAVCDGTMLVECQSGYALSTYDCASGAFVSSPSSEAQNGSAWLLDIYSSPESATCIGTSFRAFCAATTEPSADCDIGAVIFDYPDERGTATCIGNDAVDCVNSYEVSRTRCGDSGCVVTNEQSSCALSSFPDPKCPKGGAEATTYCDGDAVVGCSAGGYQVSRDTCPAGETCGTYQICPGPSATCMSSQCVVM
jgi:hypothetical protein